METDTTNRLVCCEIKNRENNNKEISKRELSFKNLSFKNLSFKNSIVFRSIFIELYNGYIHGTIFIGLFS